MNQEWLENYISNFFGFGNLESNWWFIGIEEGGEPTIEEIKRRVETWKEFQNDDDCLRVVDIHTFGQKAELGHDSYFEDHANLQSTWNGLIKILNGSQKNEVRRDFQKEYLGREDSNHCLLELYPLPCKGLSHWKYNQWFDDEIFESEERFKWTVLNSRASTIQDLITQYRPENIVFYGKSSWQEFHNVIPTNLSKNAGDKVDWYDDWWMINSEHTKYAFIEHTASAISDDYLFEIHETLKKT